MFGKSVKLFTLFGFPVRADISWLLVVLLLSWSLAQGLFPTTHPGLSQAQYWTMGVVATVGLFVSIVLHEFGHSLVARRHGMPMKGITLFIFGGVAEMQDEPPSPRAEFQVAVAGPIVSVIIGALCIGIASSGSLFHWPRAVTGVLGYVGFMNVILVVFNLVPAFPLDGGRVLRSALWQWKKNLRRATRITSNIGMIFGLTLVVLGLLGIVTGNFIGGLWWVLIGLFLRGAAQLSYRQLLVRRALEGEAVRQFMSTEPITVSPTTSLKDVVENYIYRYHHRMFPVTQNGKLVGCISSREVREIPQQQWDQKAVQELVRPCSEDNTMSPDLDAVKALGRMRRDGNSRFMVVDDGRLVGILSLKDLLKFLSLKMELEEDVPPRLSGLES